jgi:hypothetical protein
MHAALRCRIHCMHPGCWACTGVPQIGVQYASRQAWVDFLRDANAMGKLRHPK